MVASAFKDKTVRIWNAETGDCEQVLESHSRVNAVVFSHNLRIVASASRDKTVRIWDLKTGKCEHLLEGHGGKVNSALFSHNSEIVASASGEMQVLTWDSETDDWQGSEGHGGIVRSVVFSHNSIKLASASNDMTARIWDAETGECERVLEGHIDQVNSVVFSHDSTKLASASDESALRIWNVETGICKDIIMLDVYADVLSFMDDERGIVTDHGVFTLTGDLESRTEPPISLQPSEAVTLASRDGTWVKTAGMDLLWLSPECRHGQVAISGTTVVIGCGSGRVMFLRFSSTDIVEITQP